MILYKEEEVGRFDKLVFFNYAHHNKLYFCMVELDSVMYEIYTKSDDSKKDLILLKFVELNKVSKMEEVTENKKFQLWLSNNTEAKQKLREYKLNKIIK